MYAAAVQVATPPVTVCAVQPPIVVPLSLNATVPVAPEAFTVAVYVTACPTLDGLAGDELTATLDAIALTVSVNVGLTDELKSPLPR
jgi:hypothetical protein